jgi:lysophospholipase L1-like esterase
MLKNKLLVLIYLLLLLTISGSLFSQGSHSVLPDSLFSTYYHQRLTHFKTIPKTEGDIIFLGNSITQGAEWSELFGDLRIKNRGISGDFTEGIVHRMDEVINRKPSKVFLLIGVNDLSRNITPDSIVKNIRWIAAQLKLGSPASKLYVQSILPVNNLYGKFTTHTGKGDLIKQVNKQLKNIAIDGEFTFVDLFPSFCDAVGKMNVQYSNDGLHLYGDGYLLWKNLLFPYVFDVQSKPSLVPFPKELTWKEGVFQMYHCSRILVKENSIKQEAEKLQRNLAIKGYSMPISSIGKPGEPLIELMIDKKIVTEEGYHLRVTADRIQISASTAHGIFNALQTFYQLLRNDASVDACEIMDDPSFLWRGYMVDVGRNYQSIQQLKQQIDVMAAYKLNVFHFHLTEDIAWRLESKRYPQLTDSRYMLRTPGEYYSLDEVKELIAYCKERYITLIPEIDMPGHSAAFKRSMGVDMQSAEGMEICKNIVAELCTELDVPYVHIGGDEVKIFNKEFLPAMVKVLKSFGKKVVAWNPGGNLPEGTMLQMWNGKTVPKKNYPSIDSRHLYLNTFDPFDGVATVFNHLICDTAKGDSSRVGATLCNWPDRRVSEEANILKMNPVYSVMVAFAERTWRGGGWKNYLSDIGSPGSERYRQFVDFENRLLDHKKLYFKNLPFNYVRQRDIEWKLIGPYDNKGITETAFAPEAINFLDTIQLKNYPAVYGGTIWLRHFWYPMIQAHISNQQDSSTWYAITKVWAERDGEKDCWIGFNNLSRSSPSDSPPIGAWDNKNSAVWVNGKLVPPPHWKRGGQKGNPEIPLSDEGYEYRKPSKVLMKKGWNTILVKAPVGSFTDSNWENPLKWMFTFVCLDSQQ